MRTGFLIIAGTALALGVISCQRPVDSAIQIDPARGAASVGRYSPEAWPRLSPQRIADDAVESRIGDLLSRMTIEQKVGQLIQADSSSVTPAEVKAYRLGSVLSGGNSAPGGKAFATASEWLAMADALYDASVDPEGVDVAIPILLGIDAVHGHNNVIGGVIYPHNIGLGAARDPDLVRRIAAATARELHVTGHDWTFAPTVATPQDDRWGRTYEGFSEDPSIVASYAGEIVRGLQGSVGDGAFMGPDQVLSTAKHYIADGGTKGGRDQGDAPISESEIVRVHAAGYPPALQAGALSVMASFSSWNGEALHGHRYLLTDILKDRLGFQGFVVGDWNGHAKVTGCTATDCPAAINAGLDMFMAPDSWKGLYETTLAAARDGRIPANRLDDAVRRILRAKLVYGVFDRGRPSTRPHAGQEAVLGAPAHRALAREAVRKSLVLLKNNGGVLPLPASARVLVAGDAADSISRQSGGWTLTWQGGVPYNALFPKGQSILQAVREKVRAGGGQAVLSSDGSYRERPYAAIVVFGEVPYAEFQGDLEHVGFRDPSAAALETLRRLKAEGIPTVAVFLSGRPLWVNRELNAADAFVAAWLPGSEGGGIADVLFRAPNGEAAYDFVGTLSFSWPRTAVQTPLNVGESGYDPLFPIGYGLSYKTPSPIATLPEDSGLPAGSERPPGVYFTAGVLTQGFSWRSGTDLGALSDENETVLVRRVDHNAQEDAVELTFPATGGAIALAGGPLDLSRETVGQLELTFNFRAYEIPDGPVALGALCAEDACRGMIDIGKALRADAGDGWRMMRVSLSCLAEQGADMSAVTAPFALATAGPARLAIADIALAQDTDGKRDCGTITEAP